MGALVTDVQLAPAVAGVRGLGRGGIGVIALGPDRSAAGLWSRDTREREFSPDAVASPAAYVAHIASVARARGPLVVFPSREESIDAILDHLAELPPEVVMPYPTIRYPWTLRLSSCSQLEAAMDEARYPYSAQVPGWSVALASVASAPSGHFLL